MFESSSLRFNLIGLYRNQVKKILDKKETHSIDDSVNFGVYRPDNKSAKLVKDKITNITRIIKELRKTKDG